MVTPLSRMAPVQWRYPLRAVGQPMRLPTGEYGSERKEATQGWQRRSRPVMLDAHTRLTSARKPATGLVSEGASSPPDDNAGQNGGKGRSQQNAVRRTYRVDYAKLVEPGRLGAATKDGPKGPPSKRAPPAGIGVSAVLRPLAAYRRRSAPRSRLDFYRLQARCRGGSRSLGLWQSAQIA
jgi:hypothetical protein